MMPTALSVVIHALRSFKVSDYNCVDSRHESRTQGLHFAVAVQHSKTGTGGGLLNSGNAPTGVCRLLLLIAKICARESRSAHASASHP